MKDTFKDRLASVTEREREIWRHIANGSTNREIAANLSLAVPTVNCHRVSIAQKMNARNTADLTRFAVRAGLIAIKPLEFSAPTSKTKTKKK